MDPTKRRNVERGAFSNPTTNESIEDVSDEKSGSLDREPMDDTGREWDEEDLEGTPSGSAESEAQDAANLSDETEDRE